MRFGTRPLLLGLLAGMVPASSTATARQAGPDAPHIVYSTYLGTSNFDGVGGIAVAPDGSIVLVLSSQPNSTVMRLSADGKTVLGQRTIHGGSAGALALGPDGAIYVVGQTQEGLLETVRPFQASAKGLLQGFVAKVSADAKQLLFCSYLGGSRSDGVTQDAANDVAVDDTGLMYVAGTTQGANNDFPVTANATQATYGGGYTDGFVSVVDADAGSLVFSTYVGEDGDDEIKSVAVDPRNGTFYASVYSVPDDSQKGGVDCSEAQRRAYQWITEGGAGGIVGVIPFYARCVEGKFDDVAIRFVLGPEPKPIVVEVTSGLDTNKGARPELGGEDVFISVYDDKGKVLRTRTFGSPANDYPGRIVVDNARGILYVIGEADGVGLPVVNAFQPTYGGGGSDTFVAAFDLATLQPVFVSYIGGSGHDDPGGIALDADGNLLLSGSTDSTNFPVTADALQSRSAGLSDGWIAKISPLGDIVPDFGITVDPATVTAARGDSGTITVNVARTGGFAGKVTVKAPDTKALKVKLTPPTSSTDGASVTFKYKVKKKAAPGTTDLVFTGTDADGKSRTATLSLTIQ